MRFLAVGFVALSLVAAQTPATKTKAAAKSTKATAAHTAARPSKAGNAKAAKAAAKSKRVVARRPPVQMQPTIDRYKEIQQALAERGYFRGTPDGTWGGESIDALKRFQKDQNLDPDGKIGSLSLMGLGLAPKRGVASAQSSPSSNEPVDPPPVAQPQP